jgi:hypothetical protein
MNDLESIEKYYQGELAFEKLSPKQKDIFDRLDYADNILRSALVKTEGACAKQMVAKFKPLFHSYTIRTAYRDIELAKSIHKSISRIDKDYEKLKLINRLDWSMARAQATDNLREFNAALALKIKLLGLDKVDDNKIPWEQLVSPALYMQFNINGEKSAMLDLNELMKIKGSFKDEIINSIEEAVVITDISSFLDAEKE